MKILFISHDNSITGAGKALCNNIYYLKEHHEIRVICPNSDGNLINFLQQHKIAYDVCNYGNTIYPKSSPNVLVWIKACIGVIYKTFKTKYAVKQIIDDYKPDIVHTNVGPLDICVDICIKRGIPHVWHLREFQDLSGIRFFPSQHTFRKKIMQKGNFNIAISKCVFDYYNLRKSCDTVIYDGVFNKTDIVKLKRTVRKKNYLLFVGRIEENKGLFETLVAFKKVKNLHNDYQYVIVGRIQNEAYYEKCFQYIKSNGLDKSVVFWGETPNPFDLMQKAKAIIISSKFEGFNFVMVEAMLNDCLVIARNSTGMKEQFDNGVQLTKEEIGLRYRNDEELRECMLLAIENDFSEMRERAYSVVINNYSTEICAKQIEQYYYKILDR